MKAYNMKQIFANMTLACLALLSLSCKKDDCLPTLPNRVYNVHRDVILKPGEEGKDIALHSISPTSNGAYDPRMHAWVGTWSGVPGRLKCLIDFDYSSIPHNANVTSAKLTLYADTVSIGIGFTTPGHNPLSQPNNWNIKRVTSNWQEAVVTYDTQPTVDDIGKIELPGSTSRSQAYTIDVTHFVKDQLAHPDLYFGMMYELNTTNPHSALSFFSSDAPYSKLRPQMAISYDLQITLPNH